MAFLTKLYLVAFLFILLSIHGAWCISTSSLPQSNKQNSRWISGCGNRYRKLGHVNCENADGFRNMERASWSQSLKTALSPPPAPVTEGASPSEDYAPPPPNI
ncbi:hypothetical protein POM88_002881 [Heracleum sosnowskyi]|uniref:Uncharacterized protein n=1 Tax=Heracleum sosnowskyi TaxID=360622 RepID=A0AAD8NCF1_9APIA|nr:hypothetical protein POM88_002881 [Heracleum sosnowskyi]